MARSMSNSASSRFTASSADGAGPLATALLAGGALDVGELGELAPGVCEAASLEHGTRIATVAIPLAVAAIGVGLEDGPPTGKVRLKALAAPVARIVEERRRRVGTRKWDVAADIDPNATPS